ncbi:hypothetical protein GQ44DRAFT_806076 [Phaeosphaeriaceae sp. PMI808]|nr:hypothetical protein GQ44DRAFT_806076 [Phaeosphaeriaceae sp. PMI808]
MFIPITFLRTTPIEALWNIFTVSPCPFRYVSLLVHMQRALLIMAGLYTFSGLTYVPFPVVFIWRLPIPLRSRIGLILLMCMSLFTVAISIRKTIWLASA